MNVQLNTSYILKRPSFPYLCTMWTSSGIVLLKSSAKKRKKSINFLSVFDPIKSSFVVHILRSADVTKESKNENENYRKSVEIGGHPFQAKNLENWAVVVAQWVERLLPRPEICGSTPVMSKFYFPSTVLNLY